MLSIQHAGGRRNLTIFPLGYIRSYAKRTPEVTDTNWTHGRMDGRTDILESTTMWGSLRLAPIIQCVSRVCCRIVTSAAGTVTIRLQTSDVSLYTLYNTFIMFPDPAAIGTRRHRYCGLGNGHGLATVAPHNQRTVAYHR